MSDDTNVAGSATNTAPAAPVAAPVVSAAPAAPSAPAEPALSINDFCMRLSETLRRPELLSAFAHTETIAGRLGDTATAYRARFDAFLKQPA